MARVTIALVRGTGLVSRLIQWQTRSPYSHAAFVLEEPGRPRREVIEAWQGAGGVRRYVPTDREWFEQMDFYQVEVTEAQRAAFVAWMQEQIGRPYDYWAVAKFLSRRKAGPDGKWFCSEVIFHGLAELGVRLLERIAAWAVPPGLMALSPKLVPLAREFVGRGEA